MKLPDQVLVICNLLRAKHKVTGSGSAPTRKIAGRTFEAKHVAMAKQVLYIARLERRRLLEAAIPKAVADTGEEKV